MMVGSDWLLAEVQRGERGADPARLILRTEILTAHRTGHILNLNGEYQRRKITHAMRYGAVAAVVVPCLRCGWQAKLTDWVRHAMRATDERQAALDLLYSPRHPEDTAYMRPCPGEGYARDMLLITSTPAARD